MELLFVEAQILLGKGIFKSFQDDLKAVQNIISDHFDFLNIVFQVILFDIGQLNMFFADIHKIIQMIFLHLLQNLQQLIIEVLSKVVLLFIVTFYRTKSFQLLAVSPMYFINLIDKFLEFFIAGNRTVLWEIKWF